MLVVVKETSNAMTGCDFSQFRFTLPANIHNERATGVESAPCRRIDSTGNVTLEWLKFVGAPFGGVGNGNRAYQCLSIGMKRFTIEADA